MTAEAPEAGGQKLIPYVLSLKHRTHHQEKGSKMQKSDIAFHSFIIAPKSFERIYSKEISHSHHYQKSQVWLQISMKT